MVRFRKHLYCWSLGPTLAIYLVAGRLAAQPAPVPEPLDDAEIEAAPGQAAPNTSDERGDTLAPPSNASAPSVREHLNAASTATPVTPSAPVGIAPSPAAAPSGSIAQRPDSSETHTAAQKTYPATEKVAPAPAPLVDVLGYAQLEYQSHQDSEEQLRQGGALLNQDRFLVRRARLVLKRRWQFTSLELEFDGNTNSGPAVGLNRAEAALFYARESGAPPLVQLTAGMFRLPFGRELPESSVQRWFMERSQLSRALFPSEIDVGVRLSGTLSMFRYALAMTNGEPLGTRAGFPLQDPNRNKDLTFSVGADADLVPGVKLGGGISLNQGKGFHAGTGATKNTVAWSDTNENGVVDMGELTGSAGQAETPSKSFERWAIGADVDLSVKTGIGTSRVYAEVVAAKNLDRGFLIADPVAAGPDLREFGWYIGVLQQVTPYGMLGFRAEFYDPNADAREQRASRILPIKNTVRVYSPMIGLTLPDRARLSFQYDFVRDYLARDGQGVPTNLKNDAWTLRLQVNL